MKNKLKDNIKYNINYNPSYQLVINRTFEEQIFSITFTRNVSHKTTTFSVSADGVICTEPDYSIEQKAFTTIDGLPITEIQKEKLKIILK